MFLTSTDFPRSGFSTSTVVAILVFNVVSSIALAFAQNAQSTAPTNLSSLSSSDQQCRSPRARASRSSMAAVAARIMKVFKMLRKTTAQMRTYMPNFIRVTIEKHIACFSESMPKSTVVLNMLSKDPQIGRTMSFEMSVIWIMQRPIPIM